jgi:hypothetical protein
MEWSQRDTLVETISDRIRRKFPVREFEKDTRRMLNNGLKIAKQSLNNRGIPIVGAMKMMHSAKPTHSSKESRLAGIPVTPIAGWWRHNAYSSLR